MSHRSCSTTIVILLMTCVTFRLDASGDSPVGANDRSSTASKFTANVDIVALSVTVTDEQHQFIPDLKLDELAVYENGTRQDLEFFTHESLPVDLSILIDTSSSMTPQLRTAQQAAIGCVRTLGPRDRAQIIGFESKVHVLQPFTSDHAALERAILSTQADGSTSLYTALYISLKEQAAELRARRESGERELRRRAIVVLSDGEDTRSALGPEEVLDLAKRSDVAVYTISLKSRDVPLAEEGMQGYSPADVWMQQFAVQSGGRACTPVRLADLAGVYRQIATELANQYAVGYVPRTAKPGEWRAIRVQVLRANATSRTRAGYFAAPPLGGSRH